MIDQILSALVAWSAGYLISVGQFSLIGAATMGALGCNLGSCSLWSVVAGGADLHCLPGEVGAYADGEISDPYLPRLLTLVFRPSLYRLCAGRALEH